MGKRILVTGGCGFLGSNLCKRLVAEGHSVTSLDNESRGARKTDGVSYLRGDVRELAEFSMQFDTVFHLAAINGTRHFYERPEEVLDVQIRGTLNVLDACKANGVKELVLFSSSEVYGQADQIPTPETVPLKIADPFNPRFSYAAGKIAAEMMCLHARHLDRVLVIRPHNVYGPDMGEDHVIPSVIRQLQRGPNPKLQGNGLETRAFVYVDDFIDGCMVAWGRTGTRQIVHVGREQPMQMLSLPWDIKRLIGMKEKIEVSYSNESPPGEPRSRCPDTSWLRAQGWRPKYDFSTGLRLTVNWYLSNPEPT